MVEYKYDAWGNHRVFGLNKVHGIEVLQDIYKKNAPAFAEEYLKYKQLSELNPFRYWDIITIPKQAYITCKIYTKWTGGAY